MTTREASGFDSRRGADDFTGDTMKAILIILSSLAVLALFWFLVLPQLGMGAQAAAWRGYRRKHEEDGDESGEGRT